MPAIVSVKPVYGAQHPPLTQAAVSPTRGSGTKAAQARLKKLSAFDDFKTRTSDAWAESDPWDVGEPDDADPTDESEVNPLSLPGQAAQTNSERMLSETRDREESGRATYTGDTKQMSGTGRSSGSQHGELLDRDTIRLQKFEKLLSGPSTELGTCIVVAQSEINQDKYCVLYCTVGLLELMILAVSLFLLHNMCLRNEHENYIYLCLVLFLNRRAKEVGLGWNTSRSKANYMETSLGEFQVKQ